MATQSLASPPPLYLTLLEGLKSPGFLLPGFVMVGKCLNLSDCCVIC